MQRSIDYPSPTQHGINPTKVTRAIQKSSNFCFSENPYFCPFLPTFDYVSLLLPTFDYVSQSLPTFDYVSLLLTTFDYISLLLTTFDYFWLLLTNFDYFWLHFTTSDYFWLLLTTIDHTCMYTNNGTKTMWQSHTKLRICMCLCNLIHIYLCIHTNDVCFLAGLLSRPVCSLSLFYFGSRSNTTNPSSPTPLPTPPLF
jgi:hypothetical protein